MIFTRGLMDQKETHQVAKKTFFYAYKALFKYKIQKIHIQNQSSRLKHKPNFNLICTKELITLHMQHGFDWEIWLYDLSNDSLKLNNIYTNEEQWNTFVDLFEYVRSQADYPHVLYSKTS